MTGPETSSSQTDSSTVASLPASATLKQLPDSHRQSLQKILAACPLIPVITINRPEEALPLGRALVAGGIQVLEITLRTPHGTGAISELRRALPDVWVGAGTVLEPWQYRAAEEAGAQFIVSPGITDQLLDHAADARAPLLPGIATMSELMLGYQRGCREFKFFPAETAGGRAALKAFSGPFPQVTFCPTGGVRQQTARDYLALGNVLAVGGTWLTPAEALQQEDWARIEEIARESLALCT